MLSKSKGQILRMRAALHVLFQLQMPGGATHNEDIHNEDMHNEDMDNEDENSSEPTDGDESSNTISNAALCSAIDFVETSTQHVAYIAGKDKIANELAKTGTATN